MNTLYNNCVYLYLSVKPYNRIFKYSEANRITLLL